MCIKQSHCYQFHVKLLNTLYASNFSNHLRIHDQQNNHQWRFRPLQSTEDILLFMTEKCHQPKHIVGMLGKAFDSETQLGCLVSSFFILRIT